VETLRSSALQQRANRPNRDFGVGDSKTAQKLSNSLVNRLSEFTALSLSHPEIETNFGGRAVNRPNGVYKQPPCMGKYGKRQHGIVASHNSTNRGGPAMRQLDDGKNVEHVA
jgi:hypothetical protein